MPKMRVRPKMGTPGTPRAVEPTRPRTPTETTPTTDTSRDSTSTSGTTRTPWSTSQRRSQLELSELLPAEAATFEANAEAFAAGIGDLETALGEIDAAHAGEQVFVTEPVPLYLVAAAGLENVTPDAFSQAVEEGQDVAPATLLESLKLLRSGDVRAVIANTQTGGAETTEVISEAEARSIPVVEFSETLPDGQTYLSWMLANIDALAGALDQ